MVGLNGDVWRRCVLSPKGRRLVWGQKHVVRNLKLAQNAPFYSLLEVIERRNGGSRILYLIKYLTIVFYRSDTHIWDGMVWVSI